MNTLKIEIYTDGSCHTQLKIGAWASILFIENKKITIKDVVIETTHNAMELLAVIEAIKYIDKMNYKGELLVYTDSQYVSRLTDRKDKLKQKKFLSKQGNPIQNSNLVQTLIQQIESHNILFIKIKAHQKTGNISSLHNEEVDKIARELVRERVKLFF